MKILVTGGSGYIGSHTVLQLLQAGHEVFILDDLSNSSPKAITRVSYISGRKPILKVGDVRDRKLLDEILGSERFDAVMHFAGRKSISESITLPLEYYDNNVHGSQVLLQAMASAGVFNLIFSSSATVYGQIGSSPISETAALGRPTNAYGRTKLIVEDMMHDAAGSDPRWSIGILRYFNPIGAHSSGLIGEVPNGTPQNLVPYMSKVAMGKMEQLIIFGDDYCTHDGTGVRDYIHVDDLSEGHLKALNFLKSNTGVHTWNLGTGQGFSVLEMVKEFENILGESLPYRFAARRPGDVAICYANATKAELDLNWKASRSLTEMLSDFWRWQITNPDGYN